jgi:polygalacturonase
VNELETGIFIDTGYKAGESPLPNNAANCSVKDFGAKGNNVSDDTLAFINAIAALSGSGGVIYIPPGEMSFGVLESYSVFST